MVTGASSSAHTALASENRSSGETSPGSARSPSASRERSSVVTCAHEAARVRPSTATPVSRTLARTNSSTSTGCLTTIPAAGPAASSRAQI